jgi:regulatory protein
LLSRREYSTAEITGRLLDRGYAEQDVQAAVVSLRQEGLLDDARAGRAHVRTSALVKGRGRHRIRRELEARGLDRTAIDIAVGEVPPVQELETLQRLVARNLRNQPLDRDAERRLYQRLLRRGFDARDITEALQRARTAADG